MIGFQVTVKNVGDVFGRHSVDIYPCLSRLPFPHQTAIVPQKLPGSKVSHFRDSWAS